jgi:Gas vesicle protein
MELIDLLDRVLDKGIVVDASSRLLLSGTHLSSHKKHVVIESIETFLHHAEARVVEKNNQQKPLRAVEHPMPPVLRSRSIR